MKTKIYGASDDLIEIEGKISDETSGYETKKSILCSDGTKATIHYGGDGQWLINVKVEGALFDKLVKHQDDEDNPHTDEDCIGYSPYSDVLVLKDGIEWVKVGGKKFK